MKKNQKGFSLIELLIVVVILGILAAIAIPNLLASRRSSNEASAIASLRVVSSAQATYRTYNPTYGNLTALGVADLLDQTISNGGKSGYIIAFVAAPDAENHWGITAIPQVATGIGSTGTRSFATNESGVILSLIGGTAPTFDSNSRAILTGVSIGN